MPTLIMHYANDTVALLNQQETQPHTVPFHLAVTSRSCYSILLPSPAQHVSEKVARTAAQAFASFLKCLRQCRTGEKGGRNWKSPWIWARKLERK